MHGQSHGSKFYRIDISGYNLVGAAVRSASRVHQISFMAVSRTDGKYKIFGPFGGPDGSSHIQIGAIQSILRS